MILQRRHTKKCLDRDKGLNFLKCRGRCPFRISGTGENGKGVRETLKVGDYERAMRRFNEFTSLPQVPDKPIADAVEAYMGQHSCSADETKRKYRRILSYMAGFAADRGITTVRAVKLEVLAEYRLWRGKAGWTQVKETEMLPPVFSF